MSQFVCIALAVLAKNSGVLPCLSYELLATPEGACSARKRHAKDGPGENLIAAWSFKHPRTTEDACDQIFRTFSSGKTEPRLREHSG